MKNIWELLIKFEIPKISNILLDTDTNEFHYNQTQISPRWDIFTEEYLDFCLNINKITTFLIDLEENEKSPDNSPINASFNARRINLEFIGKSEFILIYLVTTLEIYLEAVFRAVSGKFKLATLDPNDLNNYYYRFLISPDSSYNNLNDTLADRMDFQSKSNLKAAFKLIGLDLPAIGGQLWQDVFDPNKEGSLLYLRHRIVHNGLQLMKNHSFNFNEIYELTIKSIKFIYN